MKQCDIDPSCWETRAINRHAWRAAIHNGVKPARKSAWPSGKKIARDAWGVPVSTPQCHHLPTPAPLVARTVIPVTADIVLTTSDTRCTYHCLSRQGGHYYHCLAPRQVSYIQNENRTHYIKDTSIYTLFDIQRQPLKENPSFQLEVFWEDISCTASIKKCKLQTYGRWYQHFRYEHVSGNCVRPAFTVF